MSVMERQMSETVTVLRTQIERISKQGWRGTPTALFQRLDGYFLIECWFEDGQPRMQIRSSAYSLEEASILQSAIQLATEWFLENDQTLGRR